MTNEWTLSQQISWFLQEQTDDENIARQGASIQSAIENGHTITQQHGEIANNDYLHCEQGWCGFTRHYKYEYFIWQQFSSPPQAALTDVSLSNSYEQAAALLDEPKPVIEQWLAALSSVVNSRTLISGAPGTGKTTTIIKLLLLHLLLRPQLRIALCAPTGKAAHRMMQSIHHSRQLMAKQLPAQLMEKIPQESYTIHRLLRFNHIENRFGHAAENPLPYDLVIVDESSMLDVSLSYHLLKAVSAKCHVVMLGDAQQLPAVGAGFVFGDLCNKLKQPIPSDVSACFEQADSIPSAIELTRSFRFDKNSGIAALARGVNQGELPEFQNYEDIQFTDPYTRSEQLQSLQDIVSTHAQDSIMLLSPRNQGPQSVAELNGLMQSVRYGESVFNALKRKAENQPVIITRNDYQLNLFNGDIGIMHYHKQQWWVEFEHTESVPLKALRHWQCANALTVHRSQGSEYDVVVLVLPDDKNHDMLSRELLYTAVTRAKKMLYVWSTEAVLRKAAERSEKRQTFLQIF
ncbi:exodeoxyribonuclease V subunit alpha [Marinicella sp. W31]|uniref:exodeoxyribonuclease V subunit alpha n=1 Tax=Marinicella sp. W31 TaxID=3023713 RepID=UPI003757ECD4